MLFDKLDSLFLMEKQGTTEHLTQFNGDRASLGHSVNKTCYNHSLHPLQSLKFQILISFLIQLFLFFLGVS